MTSIVWLSIAWAVDTGVPTTDTGVDTPTVDTGTAEPAPSAAPKPRERHPVRATLLYLPNRFLDLFDVARARLRVGPGIGLGIRATEWADAYVGIYAAGYLGLPGPRNRKLPKLPLGIESQIGVEISKADLATGLWLFDPDYGETEFGLDAQLLLVGGAVGLDPGEAWDLLAGLVGADPQHDDLGQPGPDKAYRRKVRRPRRPKR